MPEINPDSEISLGVENASRRGISVVTGGHDLFKSWYTAFRNLKMQPGLSFNGDLPDLPMGKLTLGDGTLLEMRAELVVSLERGEYELNNKFLPDDKRQGRESASTNGHPDGNISLERFSTLLADSVQGFTVEYEQDSDAVLIRPEGYDESDEPKFIFHPEHTPRGFSGMSFSIGPNGPELIPFNQADSPDNPLTYCLHTKGDLLETDPDQALGDLMMLGVLTQEIANNFYIYRNSPLPEDVSYLLSPHRGAEKALKQLERTVKLAQRSATGDMFNSDESVKAEVRSRMLTDKRTGETWSDVIGCEKAVGELKTLSLGLKDPDIYRSWGSRLPRGVLLVGEPGTGKTLLARILANMAGAKFLRPRLSDTQHSLWGRSERVMQALFDVAFEEAPSIIFLDEVDSLGGSREGSSEISARLLNTALENMDGFDQRIDGGPVIVLAATNRQKAIDPAMLRPGRFDRIIKVPMPTIEEGKQLFTLYKDRAVSQSGRVEPELFDPTIRWDVMALAAKGLSPADHAELIRRVLENKIRVQSATGIRPGAVRPDEMGQAILDYLKERPLSGIRYLIEPPHKFS